jgi:AcrR family transcriptional regulator
MKKEAKKEEIYRAALKIFAEYGFRKTTIEDIAESMDLAAGTLYLYAKNKRDLYLGAVAWGMNKWQQSVRDAVNAASAAGPLAKLGALSSTAFHYLAEDAVLRKILERDPDLLPIIESKDPYIEINNESVSMLRQILEEGVQCGIFEIEDIDATARSLFFIYIMFVQKTYIASEWDEVRGMFDTMTALMTRGLMKK